MISETLGIRPWEQRDLLSVTEFEAACQYIDDANERARQSEGRGTSS